MQKKLWKDYLVRNWGPGDRWAPTLEVLAVLDKQLGGKRGTLWDHIGTIEGAIQRSLVLMPYEDDEELACAFAAAINADLTVIRPGAWHPETVCYIFTPREGRLVP